MFDCTRLHVKYIVLISIVAVFFLAELIVGIIANSIILQTDAFHMLADLLALIIGFVAILILNRQHHRYTYGWTRAEVIAGMINSVFLLVIAFVLVLENIEKFVELTNDTSNDRLEDNIDLVLVVAAGGLLVNFIGIGMFYNEHSHSHGHSHGHSDSEETVVRNYAQAAVLLHIIGDTLGSIMVIASGLVIKYVDAKEKFFLDPIGSLLIVAFISISGGRLLWQCIKVLMHRWAGHPPGDIQNELIEIDGVETVHEFHVWSLDSKVSVASMHIQMQSDVTTDDVDVILKEIKEVLHHRGIHSSSIQPEWSEQCIEPQCSDDCMDLQCCKEEEETKV